MTSVRVRVLVCVGVRAQTGATHTVEVGRPRAVGCVSLSKYEEARASKSTRAPP